MIRKALFVGAVIAAAIVLAAELPLVQPKDLAGQLAAKGSSPPIFYVGPNVLYRSKHIPGSVFAGPGAKAEGLDELKRAVAKLPRDRQLVLYCGCCPWDRCPNVKPAVAAMQEMGFTHVKVLYLETSFAKDWIDAGYPVEAGTPRP